MEGDTKPKLKYLILNEKKNEFFADIILFRYDFFHRNLLSPAGVGLQDAVFKLKVYRAEDLPQSEMPLYHYLALVNKGWKKK